MDHTNVLGMPLETCNISLNTEESGDGSCRTGSSAGGLPGVCAVVTREFLDFSLSIGNDLSTPRPEQDFPGLRPGDHWCLCALIWKEAMRNHVAPPVILAATHASVLEFITRRDLLAHAQENGRC